MKKLSLESCSDLPKVIELGCKCRFSNYKAKDSLYFPINYRILFLIVFSLSFLNIRLLCVFLELGYLICSLLFI